MNTPIFEENDLEHFKGIDIMRAVRSFDPCLPCGVHMYLGKGKMLKKLHSPTQVADPTLGLLSSTDPEVRMPPQNLRAVGDRIEQLLDELHADRRPARVAIVEELLRLVTELYGGGLDGSSSSRRGSAPAMLRQARRRRARRQPAARARSASRRRSTRRVEARARVGAAVPRRARRRRRAARHRRARRRGAPRLLGSCDGCPSSAVTLQLAVEQAIIEAAPEIVTHRRRASRSKPNRGSRSSSIPKPTYAECPIEVGAS